MTLLDLRRYAVRNRLRIRFHVDPAGECLMDEHGVLKIPGLRAVPKFDVETLLPSVESFRVEPIQDPAKLRKLTPQQLEPLLSERPKAESDHDE